MKFWSKGLIFTVTGLTVVWLTSIAFATNGTAGQAPRTTPTTPTTPAVPGRQAQTSEQVFKNIQVLKGIPVDEFMGTMGVFTAALGISCENCHAANDSSWENYAADNT